MWCMVCGCCSSYIFLRPGETVRWRPWIQTSLKVTASQPVASTVRRATWWTTATVAWCTCLVRKTALPACCITFTLMMLQWNTTLDTSKKANLMWMCAVFLLQAMRPTAPPSCTKNVLTQLLVRKGFFHVRCESLRNWYEKTKKSTHRHTTAHTLHYHHLVTSLSGTDPLKRSRWALVFLAADFLVERDNDVCVCETPCNMTRYSKELSFVKIPSKASAKYLAKKYNKSEQYIK